MIRRKEGTINLNVLGNRLIHNITLIHEVREEYETVEDVSSIFK